MGKKKTIKEFIQQATKVHSGKYNYSKSIYTGAHHKLCIICPRHGKFWQRPHDHLTKKQNCPRCVYPFITQKEFIKRAKKLHGKFYNYSKAEYLDAHKKVCIICPKHGEFYITPNAHLNKKRRYSCLKCSLENRVGLNYNVYLKNGKNPQSIIYFVSFEKQNEKFFKVGITLRNVHYRFNDKRYHRYKIKILHEVNLPLKQAWLLEQNIKQKFKRFQYIPSNFFGGKTECFKYSPYLLKKIKDNLFQNI